MTATFLATVLFSLFISVSCSQVTPQPGKRCTLRPLGPGKDDTAQIEKAIAECGHFGTTVFEPGNYNVTRKMTWDLISSKVELHGYLNFKPDIQYWLNANNTYRIVFIQNQASWFVITGSDFEIDAFNTGGIQGNGQTWWTYYATRERADGDGRPISLTLWKVARAKVKNFRIDSPPFWSNAVAQSSDVVYDGMFVNATNTDPLYIGQNLVWNTDGIDTYRSERITFLNWDITCGDDCLAIKGNSTDITAKDIVCRGGTGIAFGSLGQYANMTDIVENVHIENVKLIRLDPRAQPNLVNGVYFKSWTGSVNGSPPNGGGGGPGRVRNVTIKNVELDRPSTPLHLYQTNLEHPGDAPSRLKFSDIHFINWSGSANTSTIVDLECSPAVGCSDFTFTQFEISPPSGERAKYICQNTIDLTGLNEKCTSTGL